MSITVVAVCPTPSDRCEWSSARSTIQYNTMRPALNMEHSDRIWVGNGRTNYIMAMRIEWNLLFTFDASILLNRLTSIVVFQCLERISKWNGKRFVVGRQRIRYLQMGHMTTQSAERKYSHVLEQLIQQPCGTCLYLAHGGHRLLAVVGIRIGLTRNRSCIECDSECARMEYDGISPMWIGWLFFFSILSSLVKTVID